MLITVTSIIALTPSVSAAVKEGLNVDAGAVSGQEFTKHSDLAAALDKIFLGNVGLYSDSGKTKAVNAKLGSRAVSPGSQRFWSYKSKDGKTHGASGYSCYAYATSVYGTIYDKQHPELSLNSNHQNLTAASGNYITYSNFVKWGVRSDLPVYIRIGVDSNNGHSIIVLTYNEDYIVYLDGNGDNNGLIAIRKEPWKNSFGSYKGSNIYARKILRIVQPKTSYYPLCNCEKLNKYNPNGTCSNCGKAFDFESTKTDVQGIYGTTQKISLSTTPYQATADTSFALKAGTAVEVLGKYKNAFGNTWYKVSYDNGKTGYLYESYIKEVAPTVLPSYVLATATTKTEVMSLPCSNKTNSSSYEVAILKKNEIFEATQIVVNTAGNYWYKVRTAAGDEGWVWCNETKLNSKLKETKQIIIGSDFPSTIAKASRPVAYKVQTVYSIIKSVKGAIYNGTATSGTAVYSSTLDAGQKRYINLEGSSLDSALKFNGLTEGKQYTLVITANLAYGYYDSGDFKSYEYTVSKEWTFTVKSSSSASCSHTYDNACDTSCNKCGETRSTSHTYDNACDASCNVCGASRSTSHTYSNNCDSSCNVCGASRSTSHTYDNSCDSSCNVCGASRSTSHTYSNNCDSSCNVCGATRSVSHTYDNACDSSCNVCGASRSTSHTYDNSCDSSCNVCGASRSTSHTYDNACDTNCNTCGYERENVQHSFDSYEYDFPTHWKVCSICGEKGTPESHSTSIQSNRYDETYHAAYCTVCDGGLAFKHSYDNDCDKSCNECNYVRSVTHTYDNACDSSCNVCGATRSVSHTYDNNCDQSCNKCGEIRGVFHFYDNGCDPYCNVCGEPKSMIIHTYSNDCDSSCNVCGATRSASHTYDNACDSSCNVCGASRSTSHTYDNACDSSCNVCGASRSTSHTYDNSCDSSCNVCGVTRSASHTYSNGCDLNCNVCGAIRSISHTYDNACDTKCNVCGYSRSVNHAFNSGVVTKEPTEDEKGEITYTCTVCGEKKYEDVDALGGNNQPNNQPNDQYDNQDTTDGLDTTTVIIIAACVAVVAVMGTALVMKKKN